MSNRTVFLTRLEQYGKENNIPIIPPETAAFLATVVQQEAPRAVLEIGTAIGYSTLLIAMNMHPEGQITTIEIDKSRKAEASRFLVEAGYEKQVTLLTGDAGLILETLTGCFDFVFIDAAKGQYPAYLRQIIPKLTDSAVIVADNVLFRGYVAEPASTPRRFKTIVKRLTEYLEMVTQDSCFDTEVHEIGDGLAVTRFTREKSHE